MTNDLKKLNDSSIEITFNFTNEDIKPFISKATLELGKDLKVDGFRPGKVPEDVIKQKFGDSVIFEEATRLCIQNAYPKYITENQIEVVEAPEITITKLALNTEAECVIKVGIIPELKLPDYMTLAKDVMKTKKETNVEEKEIEDTLKWIQESRSSFKELQREAKEHDIVDIDYTITLDGKELEELKGTNYKFILGKEQLFKELDTTIVNAKIGESKEFEITFPMDFSMEMYRGKKAVMKATLNKILERVLPELNDEFAKTLGKFENMEELKNNIKEGVLKEKQLREEDRIKLAILEKIREDIKVEVPEKLVEREITNGMEDIKYKIAEMGMEFEEYLKQINKTTDDIRNDLKEEAKNKVLNALILRTIIRQEKLTVKEEEITEKAKRILTELSYQNPNANEINPEIIRNYSEEILKNDKVFEMLMKVE